MSFVLFRHQPFYVDSIFPNFSRIKVRTLKEVYFYFVSLTFQLLTKGSYIIQQVVLVTGVLVLVTGILNYHYFIFLMNITSYGIISVSCVRCFVLYR